MDIYLVKCQNCGKIFKAHKEGNELITDFGDNITDKCLFCNAKNSKILKTQDWVADQFFRVKGNRR